jgi:hypothetical protein
MPVPENWHENYAKGNASTKPYWNLAKKLYPLKMLSFNNNGCL